MTKDIFRNKRDFARAEFATEFYKPVGRPRPREAKSQQNQFPPEHLEGLHGKKVPMNKRLT